MEVGLQTGRGVFEVLAHISRSPLEALRQFVENASAERVRFRCPEGVGATGQLAQQGRPYSGPYLGSRPVFVIPALAGIHGPTKPPESNGHRRNGERVGPGEKITGCGARRPFRSSARRDS